MSSSYEMFTSTQKKPFLSLFNSHLPCTQANKEPGNAIFCVKRSDWYTLPFVEHYKFFHVRVLLKMCFCLVLTCFACLVTQHYEYLLKILLFLLDLSTIGQTSQKFILVMTHFSSQREHFWETISYIMQSKKEQKRYKAIKLFKNMFQIP